MEEGKEEKKQVVISLDIYTKVILALIVILLWSIEKELSSIQTLIGIIQTDGFGYHPN